MRVKPILSALFVAAASLSALSVQAETITLKVAHFLPPSAPGHTKFIAPWCEKIEQESKGELKCQIYPAMQLGGTPPQLFNQARDGVADIVWTLPGYTAGRFPVTEIFELPFMTTTHSPSSMAMWDFVSENAMDEYKGVKLIGAWVNGANQLHMRDKPIRTLDDLKGLKVRAPSRLGNRLLATLGATPVGMPVPQMAESLSKGVIDGALVPWEVLPATKAHELTKYHTDTAPGRAMTTATMVYVMNEKRYNSLPDHLKKVIDDNSGREVSGWIASQYQAADAAGREAAESRGNEVIVLSADETAKWEAASTSVVDEWVKDITSKGKDGQKMVDEARALVKKYTEAAN
ncbi:MAG TPA: TRAP transporter substrate-binding protein [Paenalcaligenes hominis]|uniref:TRAP transporter substrate-binding protein n=1 Tax=Paenalcaligenes hominis TaxID=643674 RepID=A0A9D2VHI7_9BURK|nr:TRAP transporter substrate-binding protein [Paenalcaligenes hominis]NJB65575.1 TRAP-type C4-dicarboxylate transport system substrate-binding protein [Paenalcaligenes hominis]GGE64734.1 C4-dicarboxylate ABC transporter [Paenalcaligenes hominis]HJH24706.1 TRAP transporter substrate-binding protein [Paenalcaligenes hominis]